jgi:mannose-6-phosphate isomerase-like protein (cupin superfamily)
MSGIFGAQEEGEQDFKIKEYFNIFLSPISQFTLQPITLLKFFQSSITPISNMEKVNLEQKLSLFSDHWSPKIVGELNGQHVKLAKLKGEFVWHKHDHEDELFFVIKGSFKMEYRDRTVVVNENEFLIVSKGVEHRPVAEEEVSIMLFEPASTLNTGDAESELTKHELDRI